MGCFGEKYPEEKFGREKIKCSVLESAHARRYKRLKQCGTFECPFYKPEGQEHMVRIGEDLYPPPSKW